MKDYNKTMTRRKFLGFLAFIPTIPIMAKLSFSSKIHPQIPDLAFIDYVDVLRPTGVHLGSNSLRIEGKNGYLRYNGRTLKIKGNTSTRLQK